MRCANAGKKKGTQLFVLLTNIVEEVKMVLIKISIRNFEIGTSIQKFAIQFRFLAGPHKLELISFLENITAGCAKTESAL